MEGDWSQVQSKRFLFEPDRETMQKLALDAESSLLERGATIALRVHITTAVQQPLQEKTWKSIGPRELVLPAPS